MFKKRHSNPESEPMNQLPKTEDKVIVPEKGTPHYSQRIKFESWPNTPEAVESLRSHITEFQNKIYALSTQGQEIVPGRPNYYKSQFDMAVTSVASEAKPYYGVAVYSSRVTDGEVGLIVHHSPAGEFVETGVTAVRVHDKERFLEMDLEDNLALWDLKADPEVYEPLVDVGMMTYAANSDQPHMTISQNEKFASPLNETYDATAEGIVQNLDQTLVHFLADLEEVS